MIAFKDNDNGQFVYFASSLFIILVYHCTVDIVDDDEMNNKIL